MKKTFDDFITAYKSASTEIKRVIDSEEIGLFAEKLLEDKKYVNVKLNLIVLISNRLLDIIEDEDLDKDLMDIGINETDRQSIIIKIKIFIKEILEKNQENKPGEALDINKEIKEAEAIIGALEPIRTMSGDKEATKENVYSSTQSSILTRLTGSNQTKSSDTPKWGSE
jgi:hypothetical protein